MVDYYYFKKFTYLSFESLGPDEKVCFVAPEIFVFCAYTMIFRLGHSPLIFSFIYLIR